MKISSFLHFTGFGIRTILFREKAPILGTIIATDKCNLKCKHCSVNNITAVVRPYEQFHQEMQQLYSMGIRILFFCGGKTFLWKDGDKARHNEVRGDTYGKIMENINKAASDNICFHMAINQINKAAVGKA